MRGSPWASSPRWPCIGSSPEPAPRWTCCGTRPRRRPPPSGGRPCAAAHRVPWVGHGPSLSTADPLHARRPVRAPVVVRDPGHGLLPPPAAHQGRHRHRARRRSRGSLSLTPMADPPSERTQVKRHADRAVYDRGTIHAILDEALFCHVAVVVDRSPRVIPTIHARSGDTLFIHG